MFNRRETVGRKEGELSHRLWTVGWFWLKFQNLTGQHYTSHSSRSVILRLFFLHGLRTEYRRLARREHCVVFKDQSLTSCSMCGRVAFVYQSLHQLHEAQTARVCGLRPAGPAPAAAKTVQVARVRGSHVLYILLVYFHVILTNVSLS